MGFFSKLFKLIAIVLAVIAIVYVIIAALVAVGLAGAIVPEFLLFAGLSSAWPYVGMAMLVGVISAMVSEEGFTEVVGGVGEAVSTVTSAVGGVVSSGVGGLVSGVVSAINPLWIGGGLLAWYVLSDSGSKKDKRERREPSPVVTSRVGMV